MCDILITALGSVFEYALGVASGIWGGIALYRWNIRRKGIEEFSEAVYRELKEASELSDNIDERLTNWHRDSIRRLQAHAIFLKASRKRQWEKVKDAYELYTFTGKTHEYQNYQDFPRAGLHGREGLMELLANLLRKLHST